MPRSDQGVRNDRYKVIPRTLIFLTRGEEVLLLKGGAHKRLWANQYNGIGGHIERGEDALSAARRELAEESGLQVTNLVLCGTVLVDAGEMTGIGIYVYKGNYEGGEILSSDEGQLEWINIYELDRLPLVEDLKVLLPRLLRMGPCEPPFSALYDYDEKDELCVHFGS
jgi:8-oxo-dGTP diphosphatase